MKRFWHTFLAIVATATMANTANAQWSPSGEIGSYQSILSRAGYGDGSAMGAIGAVGAQMPMQTGPGTAMAYGAGANCANGNCGSVGGGYATGAYSGQVGASVGTNPSAYGAYGYSSGLVQGAASVPQGMPVQGMPVQGMPVQGMPVQGMPVQGMPVQGMPVQGGVVQGPAMGVPVQSGVVSGYAGNVEGGAVIDQGYVGNNGGAYSQPSPIINYTQPAPAVGQPCAQPVYSQPVYQAPVYAQPTYQTVPVYVAGESFAPQRQRRASNLVVGLFGINLRRDYEDGVKLGYAPLGDFFSDGVQHGSMTGYGVSLANRKSGGSGWEVRYWGLDESDQRDYGSGFTHLTGMSSIYHAPAVYDAQFIYNRADSFTVARSTRINSLAFNMLRNGGRFQTRSGKCGNYEMLAGFRVFQFEEDLRYIANSTVAPTSLEYAVETENLLTGFQVGARNEVCLNNRLRLANGMNVGIFNNRINTRQRLFDETGYEPFINAGPSAGTPYNFEDQKDDVAFLGEINVGLIMQLSKKARLNAGYRAIGVAGVALAADQIPYDFTDVTALQSANSNGSLLLHGFYYGAEFCF